MAAPVEVVEADDRQVAGDDVAAALGFKQHAVGDHVVAADDGARLIRQTEQIPRGFAHVVKLVGHLDMPLRRQFDAVFGERATKSVDARAGTVVVPLQR